MIQIQFWLVFQSRRNFVVFVCFCIFMFSFKVLFLHLRSKKRGGKKKELNHETDSEARDHTLWVFHMGMKKRERRQKVQRDGGGGKEKRKHLFGLRPHKSGPRALQRIAQDPIDYFLISPSELSGAYLSSPPTFHFMSALAGTLTSSSSFFIMFVSGCAVLSGKALVSRKKRS